MVSFLFNDDNAARNVLRYIEMLLGAVAAIAIVILYLIYPDSISVIRWFIMPYPGFCGCLALFMIVLSPSLFGPTAAPLDLTVAGGPLLFLGINFVVYWILVLLIENRFYKEA